MSFNNSSISAQSYTFFGRLLILRSGSGGQAGSAKNRLPKIWKTVFTYYAAHNLSRPDELVRRMGLKFLGEFHSLEILVGVDLEFAYCGLIANYDAVLVILES